MSTECIPASWATPETPAERQRFDDEATLVQRAQASDQMAFGQIVDRYQARVFSVICRILRRNDEAEDIAQEVFAKVFFSIGAYRHQGSLLSWIYRITVNECYEHLRRKRVRPLVYEADIRNDESRFAEPRSTAPPADTTLADRDLALKLLARVSPQERALLLLREVEGYSIEELSRITGIHASTVKVMLFRARRKLLRAAGRKHWTRGPSRA